MLRDTLQVSWAGMNEAGGSMMKDTISLAEVLAGTLDADRVYVGILWATALMRVALPTHESVILLPIVGNAAEHASAIMFTMKDKLDISLGVAIGSSTQISMFGVSINQMDFQLFETATLFITVLVVAFMLQEGTSNFLKGLMLIFRYLIAAASFFVHKDPSQGAMGPMNSKKGPTKIIKTLKHSKLLACQTNELLTVKLSPKTRKQIRLKWAHALIVKVFGGSVGFHFLRNRVMSLWKLVGRLDCVNLGKHCFLMRFGLVEDYNNVLNGGPWFIGEHFLSIQRWEPNFKSTNVSCSLVAVWIRLPELPFEYYELDVLKEIGNTIGPVLRINLNTVSEARGWYARICVQIDLSHRREGCLYTIKGQTSEAHVVAKTINTEKGNTCEGNQGSQEAGNAEDEGKSDFGPWMLVRRCKAGPNSKGGRIGYHSPGPSPTKNPVMTLRPCAHSSKASLDSGGFPQRSKPDGKVSIMGKGIKAKSRIFALVEAKFSNSHHGSGAEAPIGDLLARESNDLVAKDAGANKSQSNYDLGLVRQGRDEGLDSYLPSDASKSQRGLPSPDRPGVDGMGRPLMDILIRQTNEGRGKGSRLESFIVSISRAKLERIKLGGRYKGKENLDCKGRGSEVLGK
ncbi:hypothetical protein SO802_020585 [Lithocarpus litseifolius]|uniref:DUF4283 domain-containing protein n=1 Tax=Lithocarpus litseifolius TaxID=425828 RepID=A0AAW2CGF5_9ROSI